MTDTPMWKKSTYSDSAGGNCVEVCVHTSHDIAMRDSKSPNSGTLNLSAAEWSGLIVTAKNFCR